MQSIYFHFILSNKPQEILAQMHKDDHIKMFFTALFTLAKKAIQISINRGLIKYIAKNSYKEKL